jgi:hypothetical protein
MSESKPNLTATPEQREAIDHYIRVRLEQLR